MVRYSPGRAARVALAFLPLRALVFVGLVAWPALLRAEEPALASPPEPQNDARAALPDDEPLFVLRQPVRDEDVTLALRGALQIRGLAPIGGDATSRTDGDLADHAGLVIRRVRVGLEATITPTLTAHVSSDLVDAFAPPGERPPLFLAYGNVDARLIQLRAGLIRVPFSRHSLVDETRQLFLEPASAWRGDRLGLGRGAVPSVLPDRRVGVELYEAIEGYSLSFAALSGDPNGTDKLQSVIFAGRLEIAPWGEVPREGAFFKPDYEYGSPRLALSLGGLSRSGAYGTARAYSVGLAACYRGLYSSVEGVVGEAGAPAASVRDGQRAIVADVAYRFPILAHGLEIGARGDVSYIAPGSDPSAGDAPTGQRAVAGVVNLYFFRHRVKASTLFRAARGIRPSGGTRDRQEGILEFTVGF